MTMRNSYLRAMIHLVGPRFTGLLVGQFPAGFLLKVIWVTSA